MKRRDSMKTLGMKFRPNPETGCWDWLGFKTPAGYGRTGFQHRRESAHRLVYELLTGPIPEGFQIDHLCNNRGCVNPEHLEAVLPEENYLRADQRRGIPPPWQSAWNF